MTALHCAMLGPADSLFPAQVARAMRARGVHVTLVSDGPPADGDAFDEAVMVRPSLPGRAAAGVLRRSRVERAAARLRAKHYVRTTDRREPDFWEWRFADHWAYARDRAAAADRVGADFVFAHEATSFGYAASLCRTRPRVLFPWGGDIFLACESSAGVDRLVRRSLAGADLIVPSSAEGGRRIFDRFRVDKAKIKPVSWGVDLANFRRLTGDRAADVRRSLGLPTEGPVVMNVRRLREVWGSVEAVQTIAEVLMERPDACGILLGGGEEADYRSAEEKFASAGVEGRVAIVRDVVPIERVAELYGVSDVALSLMPIGDMRSSSVLQAAAAGALPVLTGTWEYDEMKEAGFDATLITPYEAATREVLDLFADPRRPQRAAANLAWLREHEDHDRQMDRLLGHIRELITSVKPA